MHINKIKIEVSIYTLRQVNEALKCLKHKSMSNDRIVKVTRSVVQQVYKKLLKKEIDKDYSTEKFKLTFEYYEAHYLETVLILLNTLEYSHEVQTVINDLNQKLA